MREDQTITVTRRLTNHAKAEQAKELGFNEVVDTSFEKLGDGVRRITDGYGADIVIDGIGGEVLSEALGALAMGGSLTTLGYASSRDDSVTNVVECYLCSAKHFVDVFSCFHSNNKSIDCARRYLKAKAAFRG